MLLDLNKTKHLLFINYTLNMKDTFHGMLNKTYLLEIILECSFYCYKNVCVDVTTSENKQVLLKKIFVFAKIILKY